ncbi:MAG: ABC transporter ATP-binding protein [Lachnospiraceae bacterium]|nr:ABC transporter ATP-binding protein [Lachnospiraceae bacterium]RKI22403.1 ABC transporter ATP-binding protein [bacterium D16-36]RKI64237.1 ABC transporter ATP-binding protein [bacterium 1xD8-6]
MEDKQYETGVLLKRFLPYYKKHWRVIVTDLFCAGLTTICDLVLPMIIRYITNTGMRDLASLTAGVVGKLALLYLVLRVIDCLANYYMADMGHVMGARIETDMRRDAYGHLQKLSNTFYNNTKIGQIMGRITNDLFDVTEFSHHCPEEFFIAGVKTVVSFVILAGVNLPLTLIVFAIVPVMVAVCAKLNRQNRKAFARQRVQIGELNANIEDSLLGQKVVKTFTNEEMEIEKFQEGNARFYQIKKETYCYMARFQTATRAFDGLMYLAVVLAGGLFLVERLITPGDLVAYTMYVSTLIGTIRRIIEFAEQFQRGITGIERFLQIMDADIEIFDAPGAVEMPKPAGEISFDHVTFSYPDDKNIVFRDLNLSVHAGEKLAIVGPSGGGKTTLCNLIPRFYDIDKGAVTIDGVDIRKYTLKSLRQNIGMVQQDVYLFSGTVLENILYGKAGAGRDEAVEAAKKAGAHEFIMSLKDGYDTYVGERGVKLSGGQKQRISIARVFLKNPPIMVLDEATSALDNESEYVVAHSLNELSKGRTTITIAHRLSTIKNSDRILVLTEEGVSEEGNHESLMAKKGVYYDFYTMADRFESINE